MKKILAFILSICILSSMVACSSGETPNTSTPTTTEIVESTTQESTSTETTASDAINTDEKLLTVEITLPATFLEGEDMSTFDAGTYAKENDFKSATLNDDGSITIVMSKSKHRELLKEMQHSLEDSFSQLVEADETPYIKEIIHNDDFSVIDIKVIRSDYENTIDLTPFVAGVYAAMYQAFLDMEYHCEINIIDVDTGDIIETTELPAVQNEQQ